MSTFKLLTYNIHKGFNAGNRQFILKKIKESIQTVHADVVCLQEVLGHHENQDAQVSWPTQAQFEFLADQVWPHYSYGKNAAYQQGHHGNAVLSQFPIVSWTNEDVSHSQWDRRGLLHTVVHVPEDRGPLHIICVHLGLLEKMRRQQLHKLQRRIEKFVPPGAPLVVSGDFNDWRENASPLLAGSLGMDEAFVVQQGRHAATFPAWMPFLKLDRIYYRDLDCVSAQILHNKMWSGLSDHLPLIAEFKTRS